MFVGVESERYLKTLAQLGEGGPRQWWVRDCFEWKCEEIEQFEVAPHPAYSATFSPKEKAKNLC